ncbi:hypothetical protein GQ600_8573 [Phytophthora cactorum]|nr:hypothetical protein GQ600_8573 [Phytophthora cactorum]
MQLTFILKSFEQYSSCQTTV